MNARLAVLIVVGCSAPPPAAPPHNVSVAARVRVAATDQLGWIGLATSATQDSTHGMYVPTHASYPLVLATDAPLDPGAAYAAIGVTGSVHRFTARPRDKIAFGCDGTTLAVTPFAGPRIAPGPAWILPPGAPADWQPVALAIRSGAATTTHHRYDVGPLALELTRNTPARGVLAINRGGAAVHAIPFERQPMDGSEPEDAIIDLTVAGPGIPSPIGAWSFSPGGPILLVLEEPGWEGTSLAAWLVDATTAAPIEAMSTYLYACAF